MPLIVTDATFVKRRQHLIDDAIYTIASMIKKNSNLPCFANNELSLNVKLYKLVDADCYYNGEQVHNISNVELDTHGYVWFIGRNCRLSIDDVCWRDKIDFLETVLKILEQQTYVHHQPKRNNMKLILSILFIISLAISFFLGMQLGKKDTRDTIVATIEVFQQCIEAQKKHPVPPIKE